MKFSERHAHARAAWERWAEQHPAARREALEASTSIRTAFDAGVHMGIGIAEHGNNAAPEVPFVDPEPWRYALIEGFNGRAASQETGGFVYDPRTIEQYAKEVGLK